MELTCQTSVRLPAACAVLSEEEMIYVTGGDLPTSTYTIGKYTVMVNWQSAAEHAAVFATNLVVNFLFALGAGAFESATNGMADGTADGLSTGGVIGHFWRGQGTFGRVATFAVGALAGWYVADQLLYYYKTAVALYGDLKTAYEQAAAQNAAASTGVLAAA